MITFDEASHTYTVDGEIYPSVTQLLRDGVPKPALATWAANTVAAHAVDHWDELAALPPSQRLSRLKASPWADRDTAATRGTEIHTIAEQLAHGEQVTVPDDLAGHVDAALAWLDTHQPKIIASEVIIVNRRYRYAGRADYLIDTSDGVVVADVKTSRSGIYAETALQVAAYAHAETYLGDDGEEHPLTDLEINREVGYAIWLRADGYDIHPLDISEQTYRVFLHAAVVARRIRTPRTFVGDALLPRDTL